MPTEADIVLPKPGAYAAHRPYLPPDEGYTCVWRAASRTTAPFVVRSPADLRRHGATRPAGHDVLQVRCHSGHWTDVGFSSHRSEIVILRQQFLTPALARALFEWLVIRYQCNQWMLDMLDATAAHARSVVSHE